MDTINTSIDTNSVDKKKKSFLPKLLIALSSLFSIVGVGLAILPNYYKSASAVSYNDDSYLILLDTLEVDYTFTNLAYVMNTDYESYSSFEDFVISYNNEELAWQDFSDGEFLYFSDGTYSIYFVLGDYQDLTLYRFYSYSDDSFSNLEYSLELNFSNYTEEQYLVIKQAIELDIAANQPYDNNTFLQDIIELLVGGIGATASGIGNGLSVLVSNIAIQNGAMSPFMAIVLIFGGLALALGLSRWVVNLIGSLGQRNR